MSLIAAVISASGSGCVHYKAYPIGDRAGGCNGAAADCPGFHWNQMHPPLLLFLSPCLLLSLSFCLSILFPLLCSPPPSLSFSLSCFLSFFLAQSLWLCLLLSLSVSLSCSLSLTLCLSFCLSRVRYLACSLSLSLFLSCLLSRGFSSSLSCSFSPSLACLLFLFPSHSLFPSQFSSASCPLLLSVSHSWSLSLLITFSFWLSFLSRPVFSLLATLFSLFLAHSLLLFLSPSVSCSLLLFFLFVCFFGF